MDFRLWLEEDRAVEAILGIVAGNTATLGPQEKEHLLQRSTTEFSSDILHRLSSLGVITNIADNNPARYQDILQSIKKGITIKDLINKVKEPVFAPNAQIK
jgi:hypothetical protein